MRSKNEAYYSTILNFVNRYYDDSGRAPSTREIEQGTGISRPTVQRYLRELSERGEIDYDMTCYAKRKESRCGVAAPQRPR